MVSTSCSRIAALTLALVVLAACSGRKRREHGSVETTSPELSSFEPHSRRYDDDVCRLEGNDRAPPEVHGSAPSPFGVMRRANGQCPAGFVEAPKVAPLCFRACRLDQDCPGGSTCSHFPNAAAKLCVTAPSTSGG
jgi:hypothetical protein